MTGTRILIWIENPRRLALTFGSKVVAFAQWEYPTPSSSKQAVGLAEVALPDGTNVPFAESVLGLYWELSKKYYDPKTMYCKISKP